jgi:hypothetical protein
MIIACNYTEDVGNALWVRKVGFSSVLEVEFAEAVE